MSKALSLFNSRKYEQAKNEFLAIYELRQLPLLLFNIGSCYRKLGELKSAIPYYEKFTQLTPGHPLVTEAQAYLEQMRAKLEADRMASAIQVNREQTEQQLRIAEERRLEAEKLARSNDALRKKAEAELLSNKSKESERPVYKRAWFWVTIGGLAVAAIGTATGLGLWYRSKYPPEPNSDLAAITIRF